MCGIFGFALKQKIPMKTVFKTLKKLESHRYPGEAKTVGGYGAGIVFIDDDQLRVISEKTGRVSNISPVQRLSEIVSANEACVLVGHVRMPSEEFMNTANFRETAQPYVAKCYSDFVVASAHNGYVSNYKILKDKLGKIHVFESEKVGLIDSEVIPHLFEEKFVEKAGHIEKTLDSVFRCVEGSNTVCLLQVAEEDVFVHFIHKGKTRGLAVWTNNHGEIIFCSRKEALTQEFMRLLVKGEFQEKISVKWREEKSVKLSLRVFRIKE